MFFSKRDEGKVGEDVAAGFLEKHFYKILDRNFRIRNGEIDIIALEESKEKILVFVEVKTRTSAEFGSPLEAITPWKVRSVIQTAEYYKITHPRLPDQMRIDAIAVWLAIDGTVKNIEHVKNISDY